LCSKPLLGARTDSAERRQSTAVLQYPAELLTTRGAARPGRSCMSPRARRAQRALSTTTPWQAKSCSSQRLADRRRRIEGFPESVGRKQQRGNPAAGQPTGLITLDNQVIQVGSPLAGQRAPVCEWCSSAFRMARAWVGSHTTLVGGQARWPPLSVSVSLWS
jgi:hypothetical protein